jgi:hypothetical protein
MPVRIPALVMLCATLAFAARVAGQAVQGALPQPWLPPFDRWQGSGLPYPVLLAAQCLILGAMLWAAIRAWRGTLRSSSGAMKVATVLGTAYFAGALARIAIGAFVPAAPAWFRAWIPASFHVVLASFVLALGRYHAAGTRESWEPS